MNYIIKLEARGNKGKEEALEVLGTLSKGSVSPTVSIDTVVDSIKIASTTHTLQPPKNMI